MISSFKREFFNRIISIDIFKLHKYSNWADISSHINWCQLMSIDTFKLHKYSNWIGISNYVNWCQSIHSSCTNIQTELTCQAMSNDTFKLYKYLNYIFWFLELDNILYINGSYMGDKFYCVNYVFGSIIRNVKWLQSLICDINNYQLLSIINQ